MSQFLYRAKIAYYKRFGTPVRVHRNHDDEATLLLISGQYPHICINYFNNYPITWRSLGRALWIDMKKWFNVRRLWQQWKYRNCVFKPIDLTYFSSRTLRSIHIPSDYMDPNSNHPCNYNTYYFLRANDAMMFRLSLGVK